MMEAMDKIGRYEDELPRARSDRRQWRSDDESSPDAESEAALEDEIWFGERREGGGGWKFPPGRRFGFWGRRREGEVQA